MHDWVIFSMVVFLAGDFPPNVRKYQVYESQRKCWKFEEGQGKSTVGDRVSWESSVPGNALVCGSGEAAAIWSSRRRKPAACILGLTGANMRLSLICGFP